MYQQDYCSIRRWQTLNADEYELWSCDCRRRQGLTSPETQKDLRFRSEPPLICGCLCGNHFQFCSLFRRRGNRSHKSDTSLSQVYTDNGTAMMLQVAHVIMTDQKQLNPLPLFRVIIRMTWMLMLTWEKRQSCFFKGTFILRSEWVHSELLIRATEQGHLCCSIPLYPHALFCLIHRFQVQRESFRTLSDFHRNTAVELNSLSGKQGEVMESDVGGGNTSLFQCPKAKRKWENFADDDLNWWKRETALIISDDGGTLTPNHKRRNSNVVV